MKPPALIHPAEKCGPVEICEIRLDESAHANFALNVLDAARFCSRPRPAITMSATPYLLQSIARTPIAGAGCLPQQADLTGLNISATRETQSRSESSDRLTGSRTMTNEWAW